MNIIKKMDEQITALQKQLSSAIVEAASNENVSISYAGQNIMFYTEMIDRIVNSRDRYLDH
jgi:hypothetical protein